MMPGPTMDIVLSLRKVREERDIPIKELCKKTQIPETTLRSVFVDDLDTVGGFSYDGTLAPLIAFLLPDGDTKDSILSEARIDGLLAVIAVKDEIIATITRQFEEQRQAQMVKCAKCADEVTFLKRQIDLKDARMDKKDEWIDRLLGHIEEMLHR